MLGTPAFRGPVDGEVGEVEKAPNQEVLAGFSGEVTMVRYAGVLCIALFASAVSTSARQAAPVPAHPIFSGVWSPVDAKASDTFFNVGLSPLPAGGKLSIDQRPSRLTVSIDLPEDTLDIMMGLGSRVFASVIYPISNRPVGGNGAGPLRTIEAAWDGEALVIPAFLLRGDQRAPLSLTFSLDGSHLSLKSQFHVPGTDKVNTVTQLLDRAK